MCLLQRFRGKIGKLNTREFVKLRSLRNSIHVESQKLSIKEKNFAKDFCK